MRDREFLHIMTEEENAQRGFLVDKLYDARKLLVASGNNIFDVSRLCALFYRTDVDDLHLDDVEFPYPSLYLHFGYHPSLVVPELAETHVEGVYATLSRTTEFSGIGLTFVCNHPGWEQAELGSKDHRMYFNQLI
jgi:hypothetical protein